MTMGLFSGNHDALTELRESGFEGPVDAKGDAVMSRTDNGGRPLPLFEGGTGHGTADESRWG
jgi:hypothetical protein